MYNIAKYSSGLVLGLLFSASASANLITNGSFEANDVAEGSWQYFSSDVVDGWSGSNIEIWDGLFGLDSAVGDQHAELNAHPRASDFSIFQSFGTTIDRLYELSFFYRARTGGNEAFSYSVGDITGELRDHTVHDWKMFEGQFVATSALTTLSFTTLSPGTLGNFIDGIVVTEKAPVLGDSFIPVPEPSSLFLMALGFLGLGIARKKIGA